MDARTSRNHQVVEIMRVLSLWLSVGAVLAAAGVGVLANGDGDGNNAPLFLWKCQDTITPRCTNFETTQGTVPIQDGLEVAYWKISSSSSGSSSKKAPIVVINGGPGMPHDYNINLQQLACSGHDVYLYDQGGTGKSRSSQTLSMELLTSLSYLAEQELPTLIGAWGLTKFHLVSDGFGTMVAMQYGVATITKQQQQQQQQMRYSSPVILSMILNGPIPNRSEFVMEGWDNVTGSVGCMPPYYQQRYQTLVQGHNFSSHEFLQLEAVYRNQFWYRSGILTDCFEESVMGMNVDIHQAMWGLSDLVLNGSLQDYDIYPQLHKLNTLPILLTYGEYDTVRPPTIAKLHPLLPLSEVVMLDHSGHASIGDVPDLLIATMDDFLSRVERSGGRNFAPRPSSSSSTTQTLPIPPPRTGRGSSHSHPLLRLFWIGLVGAGAYYYVSRKRQEQQRHRYEAVV